MEPTEYPVKRGHVANTELRDVMEEAFGTVKEDGEWFEASYELITSLRARYEGKSKLFVVNHQRQDLQDIEAAQRTIKAWNGFLEGATGYTAKQRRKKAQDAAKKAK